MIQLKTTNQLKLNLIINNKEKVNFKIRICIYMISRKAIYKTLHKKR